MLGIAPFELRSAAARVRATRPGRRRRSADSPRSSASPAVTRISRAKAPPRGRATACFELGRAKVAGRRVDQVADQRGGFGQAHGLVDPRRFAGDEHARPAFRRPSWCDNRQTGAGRAASRARPCPVRPAPACRCLREALSASLARHQGDSAAAFSTALTTSKSPPRGRITKAKAVLPSKRCASSKRAVLGAAALSPVVEAVLVDEVDRAGLLAAIGDEQRGEVGQLILRATRGTARGGLWLQV